ncbi:putative -n domain-containing protein [Eutypa lata UCREL1]|uniref:Putative-n domain-containing protein n=1 Tax=Eutypa lata (strain UCR-EL1) TaxID=1287681 RepID=M7S6K8_EUTLA|nr:putative -n domain-containing protein [Eutypa lata UCREL1]
MASQRQLPQKHNPLMTEDIPPFVELVARRRLGQTQLTPKMVAAGATGDVDPSSLGVFDYAHLRAPLPKGITSGIFKSSPNSYFLMRRSQDGYVSATGMFKATFPYADAIEEENERKYIKSLPTTSPEETAGNVWIPPEQALALAEEYRVSPWIQALLDSTDIAVTNAPDSPPKRIMAPPKFEGLSLSQPLLAPPTPSSIPRSTRVRRSASPSKKRAIASPRKRSTKASVRTETPSVQEEAEMINGIRTDDEASTAANEETSIKTVEKEPAVVFAPVEEQPKVQIKFGQDVAFENGVEVKHTAVEVELPFAEQPSPDEAQGLIEEARAMAEAAREADDASGLSNNSKRKVDEITTGDEDSEDKADREGSEGQGPRSKKAKTEKTEVQLRKERVRNRALVGLSATLAVGALIPYVMGVF